MHNIQGIDILNEFKDKWLSFVNPKLCVLQLYQTEEIVILKSGIAEINGEIKVQEEKLDFVASGNSLLFHTQDSIQVNAKKFLQLDSLTIIHCFDGLFNEEGIDFILDNTSKGIKDDEIIY